MPLFYQQNIDDCTRLAVWKIEETEAFFLQFVPLQATITHPNKRLQHLAGRYLLRELFPGFPYHDIEIASTRKPFLPNEQYHFSISHCGDYAAAIVSTNARVGVDVEVVTPRVKHIRHKFLHRDELRFVNAMAGVEEEKLLTILWSAKEAMYKWYGLGEVDFSEMMRTFPFEIKEEGMINGFFAKDELVEKLDMHYRVWNALCMVWIKSSATLHVRQPGLLQVK